MPADCVRLVVSCRHGEHVHRGCVTVSAHPRTTRLYLAGPRREAWEIRTMNDQTTRPLSERIAEAEWLASMGLGPRALLPAEAASLTKTTRHVASLRHIASWLRFEGLDDIAATYEQGADDWARPWRALDYPREFGR